jgi:hypothetical protein
LANGLRVKISGEHPAVQKHVSLAIFPRQIQDLQIRGARVKVQVHGLTTNIHR